MGKRKRRMKRKRRKSRNCYRTHVATLEAACVGKMGGNQQICFVPLSDGGKQRIKRSPVTSVNVLDMSRHINGPNDARVSSDPLTADIAEGDDGKSCPIEELKPATAQASLSPTLFESMRRGSFGGSAASDAEELESDPSGHTGQPSAHTQANNDPPANQFLPVTEQNSMTLSASSGLRQQNDMQQQ